MAARGKLIVLEGIDGSGKRTQIELLAQACADRGLTCSRYTFPNYSGYFGKLVARFLNGEFGSLDAVDAHFSALLYAGDRFESKRSIEKDLASGSLILVDRYIGSNLAHQGALVSHENREEFLAWLRELEYGVYSLPPEDLVIYLSIPAREAQRLVAQKGARDYTKLKRDILEANLAHLETAAEVYEGLSCQPNWAKIECWDESLHALRSPEAIHRDVLAAIDSRVLSAISSTDRSNGL